MTGTAGLLLLLALAAVLRVFRLDFQSFWLDEAHTLYYTANQTWSTLLQRLLKPGENGPLYYFALAPWVRAFGGSEVSLRASAVLVSLPAIPLAYWVLRQLASPRLALTTTLLFTFSPYITWYAREAKMYALLLTATLAATALFLLACRPGKWWHWTRAWQWPVYALVAVASVFIHFFATLTLAAHGALALCLLRRRPGQLAAAVLTLGCILVPLAFQQWLAIRRDVAGTAHFGALSPAEQLGTLLYAFTLNTAPAPVGAVLLLAVILLLAGSVTASAKPAQPALPGATALPPASTTALAAPGALAILFWVPVGAYAALSLALRSALFADRYFIATTPFFYALLAAGLFWLRAQHRWLGWGAAALTIAAWTYGNVHPLLVPTKQDFRAATTRYLREVRPTDAIVPLPAPMSYPIAYYGHDQVPFVFIDVGGDQSPEYSRLLEGKQRVWIIGAVPDGHPALASFQQWLAAHAVLEWEEDFAGGVHLWRYALRG